jgi:lipopolysaccharide biosynthesis protein
MKPILVHIHIFYAGIWPELKQCLHSISDFTYDLYVTISQDNINLRTEIISFNPSANIRIMENIGYDIWPFINILNGVDLDKYSFIIKLHTKGTGNGLEILDNYYNVSGNLWRKYCFIPFKNKNNFEKCLTAFEKDDKLGMVANYRLIMHSEKIPQAKKYFKEFDLSLSDFTFVAGTMFIARANIFKALKNLNLSSDNFEKTNKNIKVQTAHIFERLSGYIVSAQGYKIDDPICNIFKMQNYPAIRQILRFIYKARVNRKGIFKVQIFKIPVYSKKLSRETE